MPEPAHYRLSPSSSKRWIACPGSAQTGFPDDSTDASREGTLAHALAYAALKDKPLPESEQVVSANLSDEQRGEIATYIFAYLQFIEELPGEKSYEEKLVSKAIDEFGGTIDVLRMYEDTIHVIDLKYGFGRVRAADNAQLKSYLCLAREHNPGFKRFVGTIYQPRVSEGVTTAEFSAAELDDHFCKVMDASHSVDEFSAGDHCQWCPLLLNCDVAHQRTIEIADMEFETVCDGPSVDRLEAIIEFAAVITERAKLAREKLFELIKGGQSVPGWKLAFGKKHRAWRNEGVALSTLRRRYPNDLDRLVKLRTPAQVEKHVPATVLSELDLWHRPDGALQLQREGSESESVEFNEFD